MITKVPRKIIKIDEEKCDGCGVCIPACAEGALQIIDSKAKLVKEAYCDGLGACLGECPQGAISIEERVSEAFDEQAAKRHLEETIPELEPTLPCGCPSSTVTQFETAKPRQSCSDIPAEFRQESLLMHWPVQLTLVPPGAPFLEKSDVILVGDCVPFAYGNFHKDFIEDHVVLVACPKLDDFEAHQEKLTEILRHSDLKSLTVLHMEVPCCSGLVYMAREAIKASGKNLPLEDITIGIQGEVLATAA